MSGSGSLVGLSSGATSIDGSVSTNKSPKARRSQIAISANEITWGLFLPILSISSPSTSS
jgi:hypothetical protein